jgi:hypothetical protein
LEEDEKSPLSETEDWKTATDLLKIVKEVIADDE